MKLLFSQVLCLLLLLPIASARRRSRRAPELTPSCLEANRFKTFRARGTKGIEKLLSKFDTAREDTGVLPRNINWDGGAVVNQIVDNQAELAGDLFLNGAGLRQIKFSEPLTASTDSFRTVFNGTELGGEEDGFGADPFSNNVNVAPLTRNKVVVSFTMMDRVTAGLVNGFGAIFTDVESKNSAGLAFYDSAGDLLKIIYAKRSKSGTHQFVGGIFDETVVASVEVLMGDNGDLDLTKKEGKNNDFVAVDDWFFFLSDTQVPTVTYRGQVEERDDEIIEQFEKRREALDFDQAQNINWDGGAVTSQTNGATSPLDRELFLNGAGLRQLTIALNAENPTASEDQFGLSESDPGLESFTGTVNFASTSATTLTLDFFLAGDNPDPGLIHGIGIIFTDVELPLKSGLKAYDKNGDMVADVRARPQESGTHQFIGVMFPKPTIKRVVLELGDNGNLPNPGVEDLGGPPVVDLVAVDDWLFFKSTTAA